MHDASLLEERWRALVLAVRAEFWRDHRDPNHEFSSLFQLRLLRGAVTRRSGSLDWFERTVPDAELETSSPEHIAHDFFAGYRRALGTDSGIGP
ncbi:MAG: hypothetical protein JO180_09990 [Gemmatirosa sp.]|nr:hypothetical protein [Gemmatirosa sp.]